MNEEEMIIKYLFSCSSVTYKAVSIHSEEAMGYHTISSLQMGQDSCAPVAAGAAEIDESPCSREIREVRSWVSAENWEVEA